MNMILRKIKFRHHDVGLLCMHFLVKIEAFCINSLNLLTMALYGDIISMH